MGKKIKSDTEIVIAELTKLRYKRGYSNRMLLDYLKEEHGLEQTRSYELIKEMKAAVGKTYAEANKNLLEDAVEFMESMKAEAVSEKNHKMALEWQKEIDKVQQLHVQKLQLEGNNITINIKKSE